MTFITHVAQEKLADSLIIQSALTRNVLKAVEAVAVSTGLRVLGAIEKPLSKDAIAALLHAHANPGGGPVKLDLPAVERAVALRQFKAWFSPILDVATMQVVSAEVTPRWESPERGPFTGTESLAQVVDRAAMPAVSRAVLLGAFASGGLWKQMRWQGSIAVPVDDLLGVPDFWAALPELARKNGVNGTISLVISANRFSDNLAAAAFAIARAAMDGFSVTIRVTDAAGFDGLTRAATCSVVSFPAEWVESQPVAMKHLNDYAGTSRAILQASGVSDSGLLARLGAAGVRRATGPVIGNVASPADTYDSHLAIH
jgi:hypothetical protein